MITETRAFEPKMEMFDFQKEDFERSKDLTEFAYYWEMGLGKTKIMLDVAQYLYLSGKIDGMLIVAEKGVFLNWHNREIPKHINLDISEFRSAFWTSDASKLDKALAKDICEVEPDVMDFLCINIEALNVKQGFDMAREFVSTHRTLMVVDEATRIKNIEAKWTMKAIDLGSMSAYRRIATGTPITKSPLDLYSQAEFLKRGMLGFKNYWQFKYYHAQIDTIKHGNRTYEMIKKYLNLEELTVKIQAFSSRRLKKDCLNLPDKLFTTRYVSLTPAQNKAVRDLRTTATVEFREGLLTVDNVLTLLIKFHQINCGHVIDNSGRVQRIASNRFKELAETLSGIEGKVLIWCYFKEDAAIITEGLNKEYGPQSCAKFTGGMSAYERQESLDQFEEEDDCRFLVLTYAGAKGLTLNQAAYSIYYSYGDSLENYLQSQDRNHRHGQEDNVTYIHLVSRKTVDERIIKSLSEKKKLSDMVIDSWDSLKKLLF